MARSWPVFLFLFLMAPSLAFSNMSREEKQAAQQEEQLKQEFGPDLTHVPFYLRYSFARHNNASWESSTYSERKAFLIKYEEGVAAQEQKQKEEAKAQAIQEKARLVEEKNKARLRRAKERAELAEQKATDKYYRDRQKAFDKLVSDQRKGLTGMEKNWQQQVISDQQAVQQATQE